MLKKLIYSGLFFAGCIASVLFVLYVIGFFLFLAHPEQSLPGIAFIPKEVFILSPLVLFYRKKEVQEIVEFLEKILP